MKVNGCQWGCFLEGIDDAMEVLFEWTSVHQIKKTTGIENQWSDGIKGASNLNIARRKDEKVLCKCFTLEWKIDPNYFVRCQVYRSVQGGVFTLNINI